MDNKNTTPNYNIESFKLNYRACIPLYILLDDRLSKNEIKLYGLIEQMESSMTDVFINDRSLCEILGLSFDSRMLGKIQRRLKEFGYIKREERAVTIKNKTFLASCWNTIKQSLTIQTPVPEIPTLINNESAPVPEIPTPPVPEIPTYKALDNNAQEYRERGAALSHDFSNPKVNPLENTKCIEAFNEKFIGYDLTIEELFEDYSVKTTHGVSSKGFLIWINNERIKEHKRKIKPDEQEFFKAGNLKRTQEQNVSGKINARSLLSRLIDKSDIKPKTIDLVEQPREPRRIQYKKIEPPKSFMTVQLPEQLNYEGVMNE